MPNNFLPWQGPCRLIIFVIRVNRTNTNFVTSPLAVFRLPFPDIFHSINFFAFAKHRMSWCIQRSCLFSLFGCESDWIVICSRTFNIIQNNRSPGFYRVVVWWSSANKTFDSIFPSFLLLWKKGIFHHCIPSLQADTMRERRFYLVRTILRNVIRRVKLFT